MLRFTEGKKIFNHQTPPAYPAIERENFFIKTRPHGNQLHPTKLYRNHDEPGFDLANFTVHVRIINSPNITYIYLLRVSIYILHIQIPRGRGLDGFKVINLSPRFFFFFFFFHVVSFS